MSQGIIDVKKDLIDHVKFCVDTFKDDAEVVARNLAASLVNKAAIGHDEIVLIHIPQDEPLLKTGRFMRMIEAEAARIEIDLTIDNLR